MNKKVTFWDLEFMNLNANFGFIFCMGYKNMGGKTRVISVADYKGWKNDPSNDKKLIADCASILSESEAWVTWYGKRCDVPYLNTRLIYHKLPPLPPVYHIDGWESARKRLRLHSNRLASVQDFLGTSSSKTAIAPQHWLKACGGDKSSLKYIVEHCRADVDVLEQSLNRLRPLLLTPALTILGGGGQSCPRCTHQGGMVRRGFHRSALAVYQRFQCSACGGWSRQRYVDKSFPGGGRDRLVAI